MSSKTLLITSSARQTGSVTRTLAEDLAQALGGPVTIRDVSQGLPFLSEEWIAARNAGEGAADALTLSRRLIRELKDHDRLIIASPVYNFSIPASLKAWIDQVARAGETFRYTSDGPEGLLKGKTAYVVIASGGTPVDGPMDHATPYLRHVLGFMGITDVEVIAADGMGNNADKKLDAAYARIAELSAPLAA